MQQWLNLHCCYVISLFEYYGCVEPSLEPGARMPKPDDSRADVMGMSGGAGRMDGMLMKPGSGWDAEEAARLKSSMMNRDKMV